MPIWATLLLWKVIAPIAISLLRRWGFINMAEALAARTVTAIKNLETYSEPKDFPQAPPEVPTNNHNFTSGAKPPV